MDYSFDFVKVLYDSYGIWKENDKYVIVERNGQNKFDFESEFAQNVKFAHAWVQATKFNHSTTAPTTAGNGITQEEYARAFNENSRQTYNVILSTVIQGLKAHGKMYQKEVIKKEVEELVNYLHASEIVEGLYSKPSLYASFEHWCRKASTLYNEDQLIDAIQKGVSR